MCVGMEGSGSQDLFMVDVDSQMSCKFAKHNVTLNITASLCHVIF